MLIIAKALDAAAVQRLGEDFVLPDLRLSDSAAGAESIALTDPAGRAVGRLAWTAHQVGSEAHARVSPTVYLMLVLLALTMGALIAVAAHGIREIRLREQKSRYAATHDALTGLPNRPALVRGLDVAIAAKHNADSLCVLVYLDLDGFKEVNDAYGHETGDHLLRRVADRFLVLSNDLLLARLGGDEFALLVTGEEARKRAGSFGRHAIRALKIPFDIDGRVIMVGASIGIAVADVHDLSAEELLRRADVAMYHAKQQGPNQISYTIPPSMRFVTSASPSPTTSARPSRLTS